MISRQTTWPISLKGSQVSTPPGLKLYMNSAPPSWIHLSATDPKLGFNAWFASSLLPDLFPQLQN